MIDVENYETILAQYRPNITTQIDKVIRKFGRDSRLEWADAEQEASLCVLRCIQLFPNVKVSFGAYLRSALYRSLLNWVRRTLPRRWEGHRNEGTQRWRIVDVVSYDAICDRQKELENRQDDL